MTGKRIGYIRVSTTDQNPDRQLEGIQIDKKFIDYASAGSTNRPQLQSMLEFVREDDIVVVHSMDRLARNLMDLRTLVSGLVSRKVQVHFMKENMQFNGCDSAMANLLLSIMGAFAEFEHSFIRERQKEGIAIAKKAGKFKGGQTKLTSEKIVRLKELLQTKRKKCDIAKELGVSRTSLYNYMAAMAC
jgi:DNA invertase Pin-like site-specific DNA recombinase